MYIVPLVGTAELRLVVTNQSNMLTKISVTTKTQVICINFPPKIDMLTKTEVLRSNFHAKLRVVILMQNYV